jgi:NIPSNAP
VFGIIELRRYRTHPGRRDELAALFEREFIESQIACGATPIGQYRNLDDPDTFVWLRGFSDMTTRLRALTAFYRESQAWRDHRAAANATMIDSDDVLLVRPARPGSGFDLSGLERPGYDAAESRGYVAALILWLRSAPSMEVVAQFEASLLPRLRAHAGRVATFVSAGEENDFPALPVRDEPVFVAIGTCPSADDLTVWRDAATSALAATLQECVATAETLRLAPYRRSLYR